MLAKNHFDYHSHCSILLATLRSNLFIMSRATFFLAVVAVLAIYSLEVDARYWPAASPRCGPNAAWNECGSACPPACNSKPGTVCIQVCVAGCFCKPGYLLNYYGKCVTPRQCRER